MRRERAWDYSLLAGLVWSGPRRRGRFPSARSRPKQGARQRSPRDAAPRISTRHRGIVKIVRILTVDSANRAQSETIWLTATRQDGTKVHMHMHGRPQPQPRIGCRARLARAFCYAVAAFALVSLVSSLPTSLLFSPSSTKKRETKGEHSHTETFERTRYSHCHDIPLRRLYKCPAPGPLRIY